MAIPADRMGVGIIGAGWVSGEHIRAYQANPHTWVKGIYSRTPETAAAKLAETGVQGKVYASLAELLADPEIAIISICSPPQFHCEHVVAGAAAGKHMVIEKPVSMNLADVKRMQEAVAAAGVTTIVSFVLRWNPMFATTKSLLADGAIGRIMYAECDYYHWIGPHYNQYTWAHTREAGGSSLLSAGCHAVDALRWFVGEVVEVFGFSTSGLPGSGYEFAPNITAVLKFASGAAGKVSSLLECRTPYIFNMELFGDKGTIRNNRLFSEKFPGQTNYLEYPTILPDSGDVTHHPFRGQIDYFVECMRTCQRPHADIEDAAKTMEICFAIDESIASGKPVRLPLA